MAPPLWSGELLAWNTFGNTGTETLEASTINDANVSPADLTLGAGVTAAANGNRFGGNNWFDTGDTAAGTTLAESITGNDYIEFIVTPNAGFSFTPTSLVFSWDRSGTGPDDVTLRSSADNFAADLGSVTGLAASLTTGNTITISGLTNLSTATTFRLYGHGGTAAAGTGGFDTAVDAVNVQLNGTTAALPDLTIADVSQAESNGPGTTNMNFTVTRTGDTSGTSTVNYQTTAGTATQGSCGTVGNDYESASGLLSFAPTETTKTISVLICGDTTAEPDETFTVQLSSATNATISDADATGTIQNDDAAPAETDLSVSGGNLIITDGNGGTTNDTLTLSLNGSNIRVNDPNNALSCGAGTTTVNANTCDIPQASVTGNIQVNTLGGDDLLALDFSGGDFINANGLTYAGGSQNSTPGDQLTITGNTTTSVAHTFTNANDGSVTLTGTIDGVISYTGLEPVTDNMTATDRVFTFTGGAETITLSDAVGANMTIDSTLGESVTFANPTGSLTINAGTGNDTVTISSVDPAFNVDLTINGDTGNDTVNLNSDITFAANKNLNVDLQDDDPTPGVDNANLGANANVLTSGAGEIVVKVSQFVILYDGSSFETVDGGITIEANQQGTPTAGQFIGVVNVGIIQSMGTGNVVVKGTGGSGDFINNYGVYIGPGGQLKSSGTGTLTVQGTGGAAPTGHGTSATSGAGNVGVWVDGAGATISSNTGAVNVTGQAGPTKLRVVYGIYLTASGTIQTDGPGTLTINGTGGAVTGGSAGFLTSAGVFMSGGFIKSTSTAANAGAIVINATAGVGGAGFAHGFRIDAPSTITTVNGDITVTGTSATCGSGCLGASVRGDITATGAAAISITGTGGTGTGPVHGVNVRGTDSGTGATVSAKDGHLTITGTGGSGIDNAGFNLAPVGTGTLQSTGNGNISVIADSINIHSVNGTINGGTRTVTLRQKTNGVLIDLGEGAADAAGKLGLTDGATSELDRITAGTLNIGNDNSGTMTVIADVTRPAATNMALTSGGDVVINGGQVNTGGGTLLLNPGDSPDAVKPTKSGTDVTASTLSFGSDLAIVINGTTADTDYTQLNVVGIVDVTGVDLMLSGTHSPSTGQQFIIVNNDATDSITGRFTLSSGGIDTNGGFLEEGDTISNFLGSGKNATITYQGGTGSNDVVLTVVDPGVTVTVSPASRAEDSGLALTYTFSRNNTSGALAVNFTASGTADASDYGVTGTDVTFTFPNGTVTFQNGEATKVVNVTPVTDTTFEPDESAILTVSVGSGYVVGTPSSATGTITNDDAQPTISIDNVTLNEGNAGTTAFNFTVSLSNASHQTVTVNAQTADDTATTADSDYAAVGSTLVTFNPNQTSQQFQVLVTGDNKFEITEQFFVSLSSPSNATILDGQGVGTITNDDPQPTLSINDVTLAEGNAGTSNFTFTVTKTNDGPVSVNFQTQDGTATIGNNDFQSNSGSLSFTAFETQKTITVLVNGDTTGELNEAFSVVLSGQVGAALADGTGTGTILNDDESAGAGQLIISEFRLSGPGANPTEKASNEFIELYNNTDQALFVTTTDGSAGWAVATSSGVEVFNIPNGTTIPARGHFLGTNTNGYSLNTYPAGDGNFATGNATWTTDVPDNTALAVFRTNNAANFNTTTRLDAVGPNTESNTLYREGTGYLPLAPADLAQNLEHTFFRQICVFQVGCPTPGRPRDTQDNAADFIFADTIGAATAAGQRLGSPGPENLASPIKRDPAVNLVLLDATVAETSAPNRDRNTTSDSANASQFGTMTLRRRVVNQTGGTVTRLRFRVIDITTHPSGVFADLRVRSSSDQSGIAVNDATTCSATGTPSGSPPPLCTVTVKGLTLEQPPNVPSSNGAGLNSTITLPLPGGLPAGQSINVNFLLGVQKTGQFRFYLVIEALP